MIEFESFGAGPRLALLVAAGTTDNTNMGWRDEGKSTVGTNWGEARSLAEPVGAIVRGPRREARPVLYPLDEHGQRGAGVMAAAAGEGMAQPEIGPPHRTIWYEIDFGDAP
ncbi:MAG: hypothetical protein AB1486_08960 [Planctomycetota bacterium]